MENIDEKTVAECVTENHKTADIFKKRGIDFCCGGKISVKEICNKKNISYQEIKTELLNVDIISDSIYDYNDWELDKLTNHIIVTHHKYVTENIPLIIEYSDKVAEVHGHYYKETIEINHLFHKVAIDLTGHMEKEEMILFPHIMKMTEAKRNQTKLPLPPFGSISNPINRMEIEHDTVGDLGKKIAELSNNYTPPAEACNTYKVLYAKLKEFEEDLHQHIHLENNILFPKAIQLEQEVSN